MKKSAPKAKGIQAAKGCMKISSFFTKQNNGKVICPTQSRNVEFIEVLDSEDECLGAEPHSKKRKFETTQAPGRSLSKQTLGSPQPSTSGVTPNKIKSSILIDDIDCYPKPSTNEILALTPTKTQALLAVKSVEKLLSQRALKEYNSPEKVNERLNDQVSPRQFEKISTTPTQNSSSNSPRSIEKTSGKKKTPKKLFERSPSNLNEFNVEIIKNFVKVTPSKSNAGDINESCSEVERQKQNEMTPVRNILKNKQVFNSPVSKVKGKLNFSDCFSPKGGQSRVNTPQKAAHSQRNKTTEKENVDCNNMDGDFNDDSWDAQVFEQTDYSLDLTQSQHCKIVGVTQNKLETILTLKSTKKNEQAICTLKGFWIHSKLCIGDTVHAMAKKIGESDWLIDNQNGLLVYEPDLLISTTSITGSVYCKRKCVFNEKFRGFDPTNKYMLIGSLVHELMQDVLKKDLRKLDDIHKCARTLLNAKDTIARIYESEVTTQFVEQELLLYCEKIRDFVATYMQNGKLTINPKQYKKNDWKGSITGIDDIEENVWCPDLGVKGKIDVSVKSGLATMPLEVKTGRATVSLEHRAQVLLYIMMMTKLGYNVPSGLLLYIKEGVLKEIAMTATERRDIMIMRNELAYYLSREPRVVKNSDGKGVEICELPEPINHPSCAKCPYNVVCASHSSKEALNMVHLQVKNHLTESHVAYFMRWSSMVSLEMNQGKDKKKLRDIYTVPPERRRDKGKCLINLKIAKVSPECNSMWEHTFQSRDDAEKGNFFISGLTENNYVVISVETRPAVASGYVTCITSSSITVCLDRDLNKKYRDSTIFLDTYESSVFQTYNLASLCLLLEMTDRADQLRRIVIDREPPTFHSKLPRVIAEKGKPILKRLNQVQQRAVLKAIAAKDYLLIKGMPGTGKTSTIVALIQLLVEMNKTILITSHTHSAVDNVCIKLVKLGINLMRLGRESKVHRSVRHYTESYLTKDCKSPEELDLVYNSAQILAVTCFASGHPALSKRTLDICIVDESTQVLQCSVIRPLSAAKTFILIGDPDQLPAVVKNKDAIDLGMTESLFERLNNDESRITLNLNYRMNETITELANALTYNGELCVGAEHVAKATLKIPKPEVLRRDYGEAKWLSATLDGSLENAVQFLDTGPVFDLNEKVDWARGGDDSANIYEAALVYRLVRALLDSGVIDDQIGVIATYRAQVAQIFDILGDTRVDINTVDQFQGKDKNVVIYSCSKSRDMSKEWTRNKYELLEDKRRLNVAVTRAKHKLVIVGDYATLRHYTTFEKIAPHLERNLVRVTEQQPFAWAATLDLSR
ncbi:DNA replication ATP-dependent helicase/nuclease DNA2 isoform X2 [Cylas formicarius]|uniref:DNA replication ATP-dependent helicase/nuclease DNA2 isoform X2 n=1 Tax=Cylas formicarius TaxID=197179 RepID=UPI002958C772|nr:DNA replication ATP-dependent helicase/nuclease DNA2 isoform X2 [Cylas formicarius]